MFTLLKFVFVEDRKQQESLALASMARDDPPASSMASTAVAAVPCSKQHGRHAACITAAALHGKVGLKFET